MTMIEALKNRNIMNAIVSKNKDRFIQEMNELFDKNNINS
jgi:hypothetical protein